MSSPDNKSKEGFNNLLFQITNKLQFKSFKKGK